MVNGNSKMVMLSCRLIQYQPNGMPPSASCHHNRELLLGFSLHSQLCMRRTARAITVFNMFSHPFHFIALLSNSHEAVKIHIKHRLEVVPVRVLVLSTGLTFNSSWLGAGQPTIMLGFPLY